MRQTGNQTEWLDQLFQTEWEHVNRLRILTRQKMCVSHGEHGRTSGNM